MERVKVAIVMGGGVSLGSFSGGALAGALEQIHRHTRANGQKMEIDILSGASAGTLTLCLLLRKLALPDEPDEDAPPGAAEGDGFWKTNVDGPQITAWVQESGIENLVHFENDPPGALLSNETQDRLAGTLVDWEDGRAPEPHESLADRVYLLATLMNLNGIPIVSSRLEDDPALVDAKATTLYRDMQVFCLDFEDGPHRPRFRGSLRLGPEDLSRSGTWQELAKTALASGSFPVALEPRALIRRREEYGAIWPWRGADSDSPASLRRKLWFKEERESFPFTYGDGGAFNNEPLREAMELIRHVDGRDEDHDFQRFVLFIDPNLSGTSHQEFLEWHYPTSLSDTEETLRALHDKLLSLTGSTLGSIFGQAAFMDVREADKVNQRLEWRRDLWDLLLRMTEALPDEAVEGLLGTEEADEEAPPTTDALLRKILQVKAGASFVKDEDYYRRDEERRIELEEERLVMRDQYPSYEEEHGDERPRNRLRRNLFSLLDHVAGLRGRQEVRIFAVGPLQRDSEAAPDFPVEVPLAGGFLRGFGGFLHRKFREHDFEVGRRKGARVIREGLGDGGGEGMEPEGEEGAPSRPFDDEVYEKATEKFVAAVRKRVEDVLDEVLEDRAVEEVEAVVEEPSDAEAEKPGFFRRVGGAIGRGARWVGRTAARPFVWSGKKIRSGWNQGGDSCS